jgi:hypothetical protein
VTQPRDDRKRAGLIGAAEHVAGVDDLVERKAVGDELCGASWPVRSSFSSAGVDQVSTSPVLMVTLRFRYA